MKKSLLNFKPFLTLILFFFALGASAQITGVVLDQSGEPLIGASVIEKGTFNGTVTGADGSFSLNTSGDNPIIIISYIGYSAQEVTPDGSNLTISLAEVSSLDEVVVTGTRGKPRTVLSSPVPIDNINAAELKRSGQTSLDQIINYKVPSYNSQNQAISDATAHIDPSELRNLGPSRTLVLINGKRKNQSSQVYLNDTPGRGEVGTDMKSIPASAIERVEVLRDGAAAQYGSDAIAGVINVILKERTDGEVNANIGITSAGDGLSYGFDVNKGFKIGKNGFINLTGEYTYQDITDRAGEFANEVGDPLFGIPLGTSDELDAYFNEFPDLNITYGQPEISRFSGMANFALPYGKGKFYSNLGATQRTGTSFAFYRTNYWRDTDYGLLTDPNEPYIGYQPTFESDISDVTFTVGNQYLLGSWNSDLSFTYGNNSIDYTVNNSLNRALGENSPTSFNPGGYSFSNALVNLDFSRSVGALSLAFGSEFRQESFVARAGEEASYSPAPGTDSFPGLTPDNAVDENRNNIGVYGNVDYDVTKAFLIGGAVRFENYSDFGSNFSWKINSRYLIGEDKGAIRASVSTGFRAPSLHQIFLSNIQTTAGANGLIQEGTFSNVDPLTRDVLGVPQLGAETSLNFTAGATFKLAENISIAADYYNITVNDRVLFSDQISVSNFDGTALGDALAGENVEAIKFFINAVDTRTQGVDIVFNVNNVNLGANPENRLGLTLAANFNNTELDGEIQAPEAFGNVSIFGDLPANLLTSSRPNSKVTLGVNAKLSKLNITVNNTLFGSVVSPVTGQVFSSKLITDLILGYSFTEKFRANLTINNLFNVFPDRIDGDLDPFGWRLQYPWRVSQFGFNGTFAKFGLSYDF